MMITYKKIKCLPFNGALRKQWREKRERERKINLYKFILSLLSTFVVFFFFRISKMTNKKGVQIQNEACLIILFCLFNVSASSNITKMDGLTLSKIIKSQNEISQSRHVLSDSNANDFKTDTSGFELVTILHSQISGNFKVWHLILIVFLTWICFCK